MELPDDLKRRLESYPLLLERFLELPEDHRTAYIEYIEEPLDAARRARRVDLVVDVVRGLPNG